MDNAIEKFNLQKVLFRFFGIPDVTRASTVEERIESAKKRKDILERMAELELQLCGGAILSTFTNVSVNDLDFYMIDNGKFTAVHAFLLEHFTEPVFISNNAVTYKRKGVNNRVYTVQLITRFSGDAKAIFNTFDFTITQALFNFKTSEFEFGGRFLQDVAKRRLVYSGGSSYPICAMFRTLKYQDKGYKLPGSTIMHMALDIVRLEIKTYRELKDQLQGIDTMYLQNLLGEERYNDDLPVDYGLFIQEAFERIEGVVHEDTDD